MQKNKKASIFIYILLLINITLIIGYVVYNNVIITNNNIDIGKNAEEVFINVHDKGNINIETLKKYNSNGNGFTDNIACPTNVTMSGTTSKVSGINTVMKYELGSYFCVGTYNGDEFRIFFNINSTDFTKAYYKSETLNLERKINSGDTKGNNIAVGHLDEANTSEEYSSTYPKSYITNGDKIHSNNTYGYVSEKYNSTKYISFDFGSEKYIHSIELYKKSNSSSYFWDEGKIEFFDGSNSEISGTEIDIDSIRSTQYRNFNFGINGLNGVRYIKFTSYHSFWSWRKYLDVKEIEIYEFDGSNGDEVWQGVTEFSDADDTLISFPYLGASSDNIDDNMNSDNYKTTSTGSIAYADGYQDDDVIPRLTIFGNVKKTENDRYYNIFWNNYKTNDFIKNNPNNDDQGDGDYTNDLNINIGEVDNGNIYIDLFSDKENILYDFKILEFDRNAYKNEFTLLPLNSSEGLNLIKKSGYIQKNGNTISLATVKTGNEYIFDFKNKDYTIFLVNKIDGNISYRISAEDITSGKQIYINPIDDSDSNAIRTLANHVIIGGEKNFIGEDFIIVK